MAGGVQVVPRPGPQLSAGLDLSLGCRSHSSSGLHCCSSCSTAVDGRLCRGECCGVPAPGYQRVVDRRKRHGITRTCPSCDHSPSLRALLPEATADLLGSRACFLPDTARKMVAGLETTLRGNGAYGQSCLF